MLHLFKIESRNEIKSKRMCMLNDVSVLDCVQGKDIFLLSTIRKRIIERSEHLRGLRAKINEPTKFNISIYNELIEIKYDEFTENFFKLLGKYIEKYISTKNDLISMNEAETNLREFCYQQCFETPEVIFDTANDIIKEQTVRKAYLGVELIDEGEKALVLDDKFQTVKEKVISYAPHICTKGKNCEVVISGTEEFDRYFICLNISSKREIRRKTIAIIDDKTSKDNDLLITTEGIMQVVKGKMKAAVQYDDITLGTGNSCIILHKPYLNENINMASLIQLILKLRTLPFAEIKDKKKFSIGNKRIGFRNTENNLRIDCKNTNYVEFFMKDYIEERAIEIANYIIENNATVRQTAKAFGISKSTVHKDVTERLTQINASLAAETRKVLDMNKSERHIRGGLATKEKYLHMENKKNRWGMV